MTNPNPDVTVTPADAAAAAAAGAGAPPAAQADPVTPPAEQKPEFQAITSQEQFDKVFGRRWADEKAKYSDYDDLKAQADKFKEWEDSQKDEQTKLAEENARIVKERDDARKEIEKRDFEQLRKDVAEAKGIPVKFAKRLTGTTQAELEADADDLLETLPKSPPKPPSDRPDPVGGGKPPVDDTATFDAGAVAAKLAGNF